MTREDAKQAILKASKDDESSPKNCIHLLTLHCYLDKIFDEHEIQLKAKDDEIDRLKEFEEMVEWMELNSNRSLCDYYNNKDNK